MGGGRKSIVPSRERGQECKLLRSGKPLRKKGLPNGKRFIFGKTDGLQRSRSGRTPPGKRLFKRTLGRVARPKDWVNKLHLGGVSPS